MEITVTSRETIKPSSPTPQHLRHLKLSLIDQYMTLTVYTHIILFYSAQGDLHRFRSTNMSDRLKKSLSEVLTVFYPVAGTFNNNQSIHCNDVGLDYVEARVKAPYTLGRLLNSPRSEELNRLLTYDPCKYGTDFDGKLSAVQVTVFEDCGGMAIGVSLSHALADGSSLAAFVESWAAIARRDASSVPNDNILSPKFGFASLFPPRDHIPVLQVTDFFDDAWAPQQKLITKRFVFGQMEIDALKSKFDASTSPLPGRVVAVFALVFKCLINVAKSTSSSKSIAMSVGVNLRSRMNPPLPMHYFGNMALPLTVEHTGPDSLNDLGLHIWKSIKEVDSEYLEKLQANNALLLYKTFKQQMELYKNGDVRVFGLTSFCKFPFYEIDVGWGEPIWATSFFPGFPDSVTLVDAKNGGGIEAWVTLDEDDMKRFESDKALLEFTGPIPMIS